MPLHLALNHVYSMNAFDLLIWPVCAWALVRCLNAGSGGRYRSGESLSERWPRLRHFD